MRKTWPPSCIPHFRLWELPSTSTILAPSLADLGRPSSIFFSEVSLSTPSVFFPESFSLVISMYSFFLFFSFFSVLLLLLLLLLLFFGCGKFSTCTWSWLFAAWSDGKLMGSVLFGIPVWFWCMLFIIDASLVWLRS